MPSIGEKIGYIRGLMDGLAPDKNDDKVKVMLMMLDVIDQLNQSVSALEADQEELCDYVESIDDDLTELEMRNGSDYDDFDEEEEHEIEFSPAPANRRGKLRILKDDEDAFEEEDDEDDDLEDAVLEYFIGCVCPECGKFFSVKNPDNYADDQKFICPFCKEHVLVTAMNPEMVPCAEPVPDPDEIQF